MKTRPQPHLVSCVCAAFIIQSVGTLSAANVILGNPGFETGITDWDVEYGSDLNKVDPTVYVTLIPDLGSPTMQVKANSGNYFQQAMTATTNGPMDATSYGEFTVSFLWGYRRDTETNGQLGIRVSLWNVTDNNEIVGQTINLADPDVGTNTLFEKEIVFTYNNTAIALIGDTIAIRFGNASPSLGFAGWERTAVFDDISVTVIPEPKVWLLAAVGAFSVASRRIRRLPTSAP
jgi:hypothetical protein